MWENARDRARLAEMACASLGRFAAGIALLLPLATPAPAAVEQPTLSLTWHASEDCRVEAEIRNRFQRLLSGSSRGQQIETLRVDGAAERSARGLWDVRLTTEVNGVVGRRSFQGESCASLTDAVALILALIVDPEVAIQDDPIPPAPRTPPAPAIKETVPETPQHQDAPRFLPLASFAVGGVSQVLPDLAGTVGLALGARHAWWQVEAGGALSSQHRATVAGDRMAGGDFRFWAATLRACGRRDRGSLGWRFCLGAQFQRITGVGFGVDMSHTRSTNLMGAVATVGVSWRVVRSGEIFVEVGGAGRPRSQVFFLENVGAVFTVPTVNALATVGWTQQL